MSGHGANPILLSFLFEQLNLFLFNYPCSSPLHALKLDVLFPQLENVNKLWNNKRTVHVNKLNQNQNKTNSCYIQIDSAFYCSV